MGLLLCLVDRTFPVLIAERQRCAITGLYVDFGDPRFGNGYEYVRNDGPDTWDVEIGEAGDPIRLGPGQEYSDITSFVSASLVRGVGR